MQGWGAFIAALAVFFLSHAIPVRPRVRARLVSVLGERGYLAGYSVLSILVLGWVIVAAGRAPYVGVLPPEPFSPVSTISRNVVPHVWKCLSATAI